MTERERYRVVMATQRRGRKGGAPRRRRLRLVFAYLDMRHRRGPSARRLGAMQRLIGGEA